MRPACVWASFIYGCDHSQHHEGGRSGYQNSGIGFVWATFGGVSFKNHWRLVKVQNLPRPLCSAPLSTTFVHILRLNRLLSITKFQVETGPRDSKGKTRNVVVYHLDDHHR